MKRFTEAEKNAVADARRKNPKTAQRTLVADIQFLPALITRSKASVYSAIRRYDASLKTTTPVVSERPLAGTRNGITRRFY